MKKRLSFVMILSASALAWVGCDNPPADTDAGCGPGTGVICLEDGGHDGGGADSGPMPDGGPPSDMCQTTGASGGRCRGTTCGAGLTCFEELTSAGGMPLTLANAFGIPSVMPDPANPGEYLPSTTAVPVGFGPGGQCTAGCNPDPNVTDSCGTCSTCSTSLGGSPSFGAVGITVRAFDGNMLTNETNTGICRADCVFDPDTSGCQNGYSCDVGENVCLEACTTDSQCNLGWDVTRQDGLVAVVSGSQTCNTTTGRCEWTPPATAAYNSECETNADCPADIGACLIGGRCTTYQCNAADASGAALHPCPTGAICVGVGGNEAAFCLDTCTTPDDCFPGIACSPQSGLPGGATGLCFGICNNDSECHSDEACQKGGFSNPDIGTCQPRCMPGGTDCATGETCVQVEGQTYGFCEERNGLCGTDGACVPDQACEVLGKDELGRCVDGCTTDGDCASGEQCRIQPGGQACTVDDDCNSGNCVGSTCAPSTVGVCRAPGGACTMASDGNMDRVPDQPLRGDPQCLESQRCNSTAATMVGACVDRPVTTPDAGPATPDAGVADAG